MSLEINKNQGALDARGINHKSFFNSPASNA